MSQLNVDTIEPEGASTTLTLGASGDTVDLSNAAVTLPDSAYLANRNRIINGAMQIAQRGTTGTAGAGGSYLACDRWKAWDASDAAVTVSQEADGPTGQFTKCLKYNITTADASITVSQFGMIRQMIEGNNIIGLGFGTASAQSVTISFWVKSSLTGSHGGALNNGNEDRSYPFAYTVSSADTWEKKSVTISGDTSGTWDTDSTAGMIVTFGLGTGTTYQGTADEWQAGNYFQPSGTIQNIGTISNWNVTGVQLEIGDTATPFEYKTYGQELAACQRYYREIAGYTGVGRNSPATIRVSCPISPEMRATPSVALGSTNNFQDGDGTVIAGDGLSNLSSTSSAYAGLFTVSGTAPQAHRPYIHAASSGGTSKLDAEL